MKVAWKQFLRFGLVGGFCTALNLALLYILVERFRFWYLSSASIAFVIVGIVGFLLQKYFTFQSRGKIGSKEVIVFFAVIGIGFVFNDAVLAFGVEVLGWWYMAASVLAAGLVAISNFVGHKYITFAANSPTMFSQGELKAGESTPESPTQ